MKSFLAIFLFLLLLLAAVIAFSPYGSKKGFAHKLIIHSTYINAPVGKVLNFLGNSGNASRWSSFVNHITVLNPESFTDGAVGSRRRCFRNGNEQGMQWDELITEAAINKKRQLSIYNLRDFSITAQHLAAEQLYETISEKKCRLTFTVFFKDVKQTIWETIKMYLAAYRINPVFEKNLSNIKQNNGA